MSINKSNKPGKPSKVRVEGGLDDGGFIRWSIGLDTNGEIEISLHRHPVHGTISIHDVTITEKRALGEMFIAAANKADANIDSTRK